MNFSSSIISGIGISLGGMDTAIDLLYSNAEMYSNEYLDSIKTDSTEYESIKTIRPLKVIKPVKPKITKESIIKKFSLKTCSARSNDKEEIIDIGFIDDNEQYDFSFEDTLPQISDEDAEANHLMQLLNAAGQELELGTVNNDTEDSIEEDIDNMSIDENELMDEFEDTENDIDDIDSIQFEDEEEPEEEDGFSIDDIDNIDIDLDGEDDGFLDEEGKQNSKIDKIDDKNNIQKDEDSDFEIDEDDTFELNDNNEEVEETDDFDIEIEDDGDTFNLDELDFEDEENNQEKPADVNSNISNNASNTINEGTNNKVSAAEEELNQLKRQMAAMQKQMHDMEAAKASNEASKIENDNSVKNDKDDLEELIASAHGKTKESKEEDSDKYEMYSNMSIEKLYKEVNEYMLALGVHKRAVDIVALNDKFGDMNIRKLIQKSYLIKYGKGVTTGR